MSGRGPPATPARSPASTSASPRRTTGRPSPRASPTSPTTSAARPGTGAGPERVLLILVGRFRLAWAVDDDRLKRHDRSDGEWARLKPLLPRHPQRTLGLLLPHAIWAKARSRRTICPKG